MKKPTRMKKRIAMLLSGVLTFGMVAGMIPGNTLQVQAAGTTAPELAHYATKEQLMDSYQPDSSGVASNTAKLVFGKDENGNPMKWYILGEDPSGEDITGLPVGVLGDNTILFATSNMITDEHFSMSDTSKTYQESDGTYIDGYPDPDTVNPNHYGASDLRNLLQDMVKDGNTTYFSDAEKALMNETSVLTGDPINGREYYETSDKLYIPSGEVATSSPVIKVGSRDQVTLPTSTYWGSGRAFWLRTPNSSSYVNIAWGAQSRVQENGCNSSYVSCIRPVANLDLSNVLFASAYDVAAKKISKGEFLLRLDGSSKDIGSVTYDLSTGTIKAVKGGTSSDVWLVVQFTAGTAPCAIREAVSDKFELTVAKIEAEMKTDSIAKNYDFDLSTCKIWLEITDSDGMIYAVEATEADPVTEISTVAITDIDTPVSNTALDTSAVCGTTGVSTAAPAVT